MNEINLQVQRAQRRLFLQQFLMKLVWSLCIALGICAIALAVPKLWTLPFATTDAARNAWAISWVAGSLVLGTILAIVWTYLGRRGKIETAIEIDKRYGLKERVSSALALLPEDRESEVGNALVSDAERRVSRLDIREKFGINFNWKLMLPVIPAIAVIVFLIVPNRMPEQTVEGAEPIAEVQKRIIEQNKELQKKIAAKRQELKDKGLTDAEARLKEIEQRLEDVNKTAKLDRNKALVELNNIKKELEDRKRELGGADKVREQLKQLNPEGKGPADKVVEAMQEGDFEKAMEQVKELQKELAKGEMKPEDQEKLAKQLGEMKEKLEDAAKKAEEEKKQLEKQLEQAKKNGDQQEAERLQRKLAEKEAQQEQMDKMNEMAQKMGQCQQCLQEGGQEGMEQAAQQLDELAQELQQMQNQIDELEVVDELMNEVGQCKNGMCQNPGNKLGQVPAQGQGQGQGNGLGQGQGKGDRPEEATETGSFDSQVRGKVEPGEAVRTGDAGGPNVAGISHEQAKEIIQAESTDEADPLTNQRLPRAVRDHAKEYFEEVK